MHAHCIVAIAFFARLSFAAISVSAPASAVICKSVPVGWDGGIGPWLFNFGSVTTSSFAWTPDSKLANTVIIQIQDSNSEVGQSAPIAIQSGSILPNGHCATGASTQGQGLPDSGGNGNSGGSGSPSTTDGDGGIADTSGEVSDTSGQTDTSSSGDTGTDTDSGNTGGDNSGGGDSGGGDSSGGTSSTSFQGGANGQTAQSQPGGADTSSEVAGSDFSSGASANLAANSVSLSTSISTASIDPKSPDQSAALLNSAMGPSPSDHALGSITGSTSEITAGGQTVQGLPGITAVQSGASSGGPGQSAGSNDFPKKNVMSGSIIAGVIAAVLIALLAAFCVIRRCRRRRLDTPNRLSYPFSAGSGSSSVPREMVGRSGYPASTFSSWGNHGDLADERALSPVALMPTGTRSTEGPAWEGATESNHSAVPCAPRHMASSSSIDRNDPTSQQRFRGPIPKSMTDANYRDYGAPDSSSAIVGGQPHNPRSTYGTIFDEVRPQEMPSWGTVHDMMTRQPVVVGYPPPYTSA
ncbi:hypothetical protein C8R43DRAFT_76457 [Mycena crocata]|nr:hypothetical protein C8R43DRAFT_76457 [Mycena crocata]